MQKGFMGRKKSKVERVFFYLSHSLTFLQLLEQQPADIKAVAKREKRGDTEEKS